MLHLFEMSLSTQTSFSMADYGSTAYQHQSTAADHTRTADQHDKPQEPGRPAGRSKQHGRPAPQQCGRPARQTTGARQISSADHRSTADQHGRTQEHGRPARHTTAAPHTTIHGRTCSYSTLTHCENACTKRQSCNTDQHNGALFRSPGDRRRFPFLSGQVRLWSGLRQYHCNMLRSR